MNVVPKNKSHYLWGCWLRSKRTIHSWIFPFIEKCFPLKGTKIYHVVLLRGRIIWGNLSTAFALKIKSICCRCPTVYFSYILKMWVCCKWSVPLKDSSDAIKIKFWRRFALFRSQIVWYGNNSQHAQASKQSARCSNESLKLKSIIAGPAASFCCCLYKSPRL